MNSSAFDVTIIAPAFLAGALVLLTHVPLGAQVLKRGIVFIDLAIAQIAALGVIVAGMADLDQAWMVQLAAGVAAVFVVFGVLGGLFALVLAFVPGFRAFMALGHEEVDNYYERMYPRAFVGD